MWDRSGCFCEFCGRIIPTAAASEATHIPFRVKTLDLQEKPEVTLNKDQINQATSRSKSTCSMLLETQAGF